MRNLLILMQFLTYISKYLITAAVINRLCFSTNFIMLIKTSILILIPGLLHVLVSLTMRFFFIDLLQINFNSVLELCQCKPRHNNTYKGRAGKLALKCRGSLWPSKTFSERRSWCNRWVRRVGRKFTAKTGPIYFGAVHRARTNK